jgi:hypothetical protein
MSTHHTDPRVDDYINALPDWQQDICQKVRQLVHRADPEVREEIKRSVQPYFTIEGRNIIALLSAKDHVTVFTYDPTVADPEKIINLGHNNATGRGIKIYENDPLNEKAMLAVFKAIAANNRAGGWRKLEANSP